MLFVSLTKHNGETVYVNPAQVVTVEAFVNDAYPAVRACLVLGDAALQVTEAPERVVADLERALLVVPPR